MNYDLRLDICKKIRDLEYGRGDAAGIRSEISSSHEFTKDEIDYLNGEVDKLLKKADNFSFTLQKYFPYLLAAVGGYGLRMLQDKIGEWIAEGETRASQTSS